MVEFGRIVGQFLDERADPPLVEHPPHIEHHGLDHSDPLKRERPALR